MMRITPMAVWAHKLPEAQLFEAVKQDVSFMHSREEMWHLCTAYCLVIGTLIHRAGKQDRAQKALQALKTYAAKETTPQIVSDFIKEAQVLTMLMQKSYKGEQVAFEKKELLSLADYNAQLHVGYVKHGFVLAIHLLMRH